MSVVCAVSYTHLDVYKRQFLHDLLKDGIPTPSKSIKSDAREAGLGWSTVHRAAKRIGVHIRKSSMEGGWYWSLPKMSGTPEDPEDVNVPNVESSTPSAASSDDTEVF